MAGFDNINDARALEISVMGLVIVFLALTTVSLFLWSLPKIIALITPYLPALDHAGHTTPTKRQKADARVDDLELVAAIGFALQHHRRHD